MRNPSTQDPKSAKLMTRCPFRKSGTSVITRRTSCPRRRASSPHGACLLDSRLRGNDATHQGAVATGSVFMKWTSSAHELDQGGLASTNGRIESYEDVCDVACVRRAGSVMTSKRGSG